MELFLLIAIGITVISFISIALTKPSPKVIQKLLTEPTQAEFINEEDAGSRDSSSGQELGDLLKEEETTEEEQILMPVA